MKKAFGRLQLRAGAKDAKANGKDAGRLDTAAEPAAQPSSKITEHVRQDEVETAAAMSTGTATHSSEESHADTDYDHRQEDGYVLHRKWIFYGGCFLAFTRLSREGDGFLAAPFQDPSSAVLQTRCARTVSVLAKLL